MGACVQKKRGLPLCYYSKFALNACTHTCKCSKFVITFRYNCLSLCLVFNLLQSTYSQCCIKAILTRKKHTNSKITVPDIGKLLSFILNILEKAWKPIQFSQHPLAAYYFFIFSLWENLSPENSVYYYHTSLPQQGCQMVGNMFLVLASVTFDNNVHVSVLVYQGPCRGRSWEARASRLFVEK